MKKQQQLHYKYVLGTAVMFYETEMVDNYVNSISAAIQMVEEDSRKNITIEVLFNMTTRLEKIDGGTAFGLKLYQRCKTSFYELKLLGVNVEIKFKSGDVLYTMVDYRRDLNTLYCTESDYVIWGETDCLAPKELFVALDEAMSLAHQNNIYRFITTFATRKMWDDSWSVLEHPEFTYHKYHERHEVDEWSNDKGSIHYTMTIDEMNVVNDKHAWVDDGGVDTFIGDYELLNNPKFDGSFLCISSEIIKAGANIPIGFWGLSAEDTAFMHSCMRSLCDIRTGTVDYKQIIIKNVLKVHNRNDPNKRNYALDMKGERSSTQADKGKWYNVMRSVNKENLQRYLTSQKPLLTYDDYLKKLEE